MLNDCHVLVITVVFTVVTLFRSDTAGGMLKIAAESVRATLKK